MLVTQTLEKLRALRLDAMVQALEERSGQADISQPHNQSRPRFQLTGNSFAGQHIAIW